uniref:ABC transporter domain-containing protein n=2 Tax=Arion vulgaris TaxID=1028688 RepID=A0A0B6ZWJ1_9EUPU
MEAAKKRVNVQDYSVHQTTLEQIFLTFTRSQIIAKEEKAKGCKPRLCCC